MLLARRRTGDDAWRLRSNTTGDGGVKAAGKSSVVGRGGCWQRCDTVGRGGGTVAVDRRGATGEERSMERKRRDRRSEREGEKIRTGGREGARGSG